MITKKSGEGIYLFLSPVRLTLLRSSVIFGFVRYIVQACCYTKQRRAPTFCVRLEKSFINTYSVCTASMMLHLLTKKHGKIDFKTSESRLMRAYEMEGSSISWLKTPKLTIDSFQLNKLRTLNSIWKWWSVWWVAFVGSDSSTAYSRCSNFLARQCVTGHGNILNVLLCWE